MRDGSGIYTQPFPDVSADTTIESPVYNGFVADVATDLNAPRPILAGGTGAANANDALTNLSAEKSLQAVTNYDSMMWMPGSFYSASSATGAPVSGHAFVGYVYLVDSNNIVIEARDQNDAAVPGRKYIREKKAGTWSVWKSDTLTLLGTSEGVSGETADMSFGLTGTAPNSAFVVNTESDGSGINALEVSKAGNTIFRDTSGSSQVVLNKSSGITGKSNEIYGKTNDVNRWRISTGDTASETGSNAGSNFNISSFDDAGAILQMPIAINRATGLVAVSDALTVGGNASSPIAPTSSGHFTNKTYVDTADAAITAAFTAADATKLFGSTGNDDNRILRADGTGTKTVQPSSLVLADTTADLSHASGSGIDIQGTNTNDSAPTGYKGEFLENSRTLSGAVTMGASGTIYEIASIPLGAGDWDVYAIARFLTGTTTTRVQANISTTSAAAMNFDTKGHMAMSMNATANDPFAISIPPTRFSLPSAATVYLNSGQIFVGGSPTGYGHLMARRPR